MDLDGFRDNGAFTKLYRKRVANNQDLAILISDHQNRRGTGKTVLSLKIASKIDRTEAGITKEKVSISVDELLDSYIQLPKGSALVLDEAEAGLSKYEAGTSINKAMRALVRFTTEMFHLEFSQVIINISQLSSFLNITPFEISLFRCSRLFTVGVPLQMMPFS